MVPLPSAASRLARASRHDVEAESTPAEGTWPHRLSHDPLLRVSDVLRLVQTEFPALTPSKLRFLDSQGLVSPVRTASGYRQYSPADVERVRFVLRQQRDHYRPLAVIAEHLAALDAGTMHEAIAPRALDEDAPAYLSADALATSAGVDPEVVAAAVEAGAITQATPAGFDREAVSAVAAAGAYLSAGGDVRTLRGLVRAAQREAELAESAAAPRRARGDGEGADAREEALSEAAIGVFAACVRGSVRR